MITEALLSLLATPIGWLTSALPGFSFGPDSQLNDNQVIQGLRWLNFLLPITEILQMTTVATTLVVATWSFKWIVKLIDWIMDIIP